MGELFKVIVLGKGIDVVLLLVGFMDVDCLNCLG